MSLKEGPPGSDHLEPLLARIRVEVDRLLAAGEDPDPSRWTVAHPNEAAQIEDTVEFRRLLFEEGLAGGVPPDDDGLGEGDEEIMARVEESLQDAINQGAEPDLVGWQVRYPHLAPSIERLGGVLDFMRDVLKGDTVSSGRPASEDSETGLGRYRLKGRCGGHPAGPLYLAESDELPYPVELMILRPMIRREQAWKILREADQARLLTLDGVVPVLEVGEVRGVRFVAWEHVRGVSLGQALLDLAFFEGLRGLSQVLPPLGGSVVEASAKDEAREARSGRRAAAKALAPKADHVGATLRLIAEVARVLGQAHQQGYLHLDLSPDAVIVTPEGRPKIKGFGIGRHFKGVVADRDPAPLFRSPEQLHPGARLDWKADVYGVGALLHALLCLEPPRWWSTREERICEPDKEHVTGEILEILGEQSPELVRLMESSIASHPAERPASCEALAQQLDHLAVSFLERPQRSRGLFRWLRSRGKR